MPFTPFDRADHARVARRERQGPPKLTVTQAKGGRTTVSLSSAVRDYLRPSTVQPNRKPEKILLVRLLVDPDAGKLAIERVPDDLPEDFDLSECYKVGGLNSSGTAYFTDWNLGEAVGLLPGMYPASLTRLRRGEKSTLAAVISLDDRQPPEQRKRRDKLALQIETIVSIRDEGITLVEPGKKF